MTLYDLNEVAVNMADGRVGIDALRSKKVPRRLQLYAAIVVLIFNKRHRFLTGSLEGSYQHALESLFPDSSAKQLIKWSVHDGLHRHDACRNSHIELTPPLDFWNFVSLFNNVPPKIEEVFNESGISSENPNLEDIKPSGVAANTALQPVELIKRVLDDAPSRSELLGTKGQIQAGYYAAVVGSLVWACKDTFLDKEHRAPSPLTHICKGLFGAAFAAHHGGSIRAASHALGIHRCAKKIPSFHFSQEMQKVFEEHPNSLTFATKFIVDAEGDIKRARLSFDNMLPQADNTQRSRRLASIIGQYEPSVIIEALRLVRSSQ